MKNTNLKLQVYCWNIFILPMFVTLLANISFSQKITNKICKTQVENNVFECQLNQKESHVYGIKLKQGQVLRIDLKEKGVNVKIILFSYADRQIIEDSNFGFGYDREVLTWIIGQDGTYGIMVDATKSSLSGNYQLQTTIKEKATESDYKQIKAEQLLTESWIDRGKATAEALQKAIIKGERAFEIWEELNEKYWKSDVSNLIGLTYSDLGQNQKALDYLNQALSLKKIVGDRSGAARTLSSIGAIYSSLGEKKRALDYYNQSLSIIKVIDNKNIEARTLNNIGAVYDDLGEKQKALDYYNQALLLRRTVGDKSGEAVTLNNIGTIYLSLREMQKAMDFFEQTLSLMRIVGDKRGESVILNNIGGIYRFLRKHQKALEYFNQSLSLSRIIGDKRGEVTTLNNVGGTYLSLGDKQKALDYFNQVLPLLRNIGDKSGEAKTLSNIMFIWFSLNKPQLAIFFGQQSINTFQQLRGSARSPNLDNATQKSFLNSVKSVYKFLAELLIKEKQPEQAIEILNLYQDQQFFDFDRNSNSPARQVSLSPRELEFAKRYESTADKVGQLGVQVDELKRKIGKRPPTKEEKNNLKELESDFKVANDNFLKFLKDAEKAFAKPFDDKDKIPTIKDVSEMQTALQELKISTKQNPVILYTLIGEEKFYILLLTPKGQVKVFESPIKADVLNNKLIQFHALLQEKDYDSRILGKELYDIIIPKELETELEKEKAETLIWNLNESLRYIPVSALSPDGKKYLVEKYQNVVFTRADRTRMTRDVSPNWTGVGFGSSQEHKVDLFGDNKQIITFPALLATKEELDSIFKVDKKDNSGVLSGEFYSDKNFTKNGFYEALKIRHKVVHISSHFRFYPGDSSLSFLLLGDGDTLTLNEMKKTDNLFAGVELLTLSACETATQFPNADGREIDAFAELAQRLKANAVMATLWQVRENSTAEIMTTFYKNRQNRKLNKAESLRKAQLDLLYGKTQEISKSKSDKTLKSGDNKSLLKDIVVEKKYLIQFKQNKRDKIKKPFAHPYYWSPFVLYGNWK